MPALGPEGHEFASASAGDVEFAPASAGDVDGDGKVDRSWPDGLMRSKGWAFAPPTELTVPMLGCDG
ncbi:MAG TPA: hypothetical protein VFS43_03600 [Polyangiaceae bacterium]|nr:hypothetical protein [Polyangiaceae bacterium]